MTLRECASHLIKESDNTAWKMLTRYLGGEYIQAELYRIGADSTSYWQPNITTPSDVMLMLKKIADPTYTSPDLSAEMLDLMTNTDFEARLLAPLPEGIRVAHIDRLLRKHLQRRRGGLPRRLTQSKRRLLHSLVIASGTGEETARDAIQEMSLITYRSLIGPDRR